MYIISLDKSKAVSDLHIRPTKPGQSYTWRSISYENEYHLQGKLWLLYLVNLSCECLTQKCVCVQLQVSACVESF